MRKLGKILIMLVFVCFGIIGCQLDEPKITLEEQAKNYFELYGHMDSSIIDKTKDIIGDNKIYFTNNQLTDIDYNIDVLCDIFEKSFQTELSINQREKLKEEILSSINKVEADIEIVNQNEDSATVKYTITPVEFIFSMEEIQESALEKVQEDPSIVEDKDKILNLILNMYGEVYGNASLSETPVELEIDFKKIDNVWQIADINDHTKISDNICKMPEIDLGSIMQQ